MTIHHHPAAIAAHEAANNEAEWLARAEAREQAFCRDVERWVVIGWLAVICVVAVGVVG